MKTMVDLFQGHPSTDLCLSQSRSTVPYNPWDRHTEIRPQSDGISPRSHTQLSCTDLVQDMFSYLVSHQVHVDN